jgi:hypothetical protein
MYDSAKPRLWRWSWGLPAAALVAAIVLQVIHFSRSSARPEAIRLSDVVRLDAPGWTSRDVPLGPNEFLTNEAEKILNFDDVIYRVFSRGGVSFGVYVAYWRPGKMPTQLVASHTPDRCWTENGWTCAAMKFRQELPFEGSSLQPVEWRLFESPHGGSPVYVLYWHLVGGHEYKYGGGFNAVPNPLAWWRGAVQQVLFGSQQQYFIRITSSQPIESLWATDGFADVLRGLERLGIKQS